MPATDAIFGARVNISTRHLIAMGSNSKRDIYWRGFGGSSSGGVGGGGNSSSSSSSGSSSSSSSSSSSRI